MCGHHCIPTHISGTIPMHSSRPTRAPMASKRVGPMPRGSAWCSRHVAMAITSLGPNCRLPPTMTSSPMEPSYWLSASAQTHLPGPIRSSFHPPRLPLAPGTFPVIQHQPEKGKVRAMQDRPIPSSTQAPLRKQPARVQGIVIQAAGVCLVALVVGSIAMVFSSCRPTTPGPAPVGISHPTARPTLVVYHPGKSLGNLVYSTTVSEVLGLAWSPDSTRLGVSTFISAQSWVATTGKGVVNYGLPRGASMASVPAVVWSPDGKLVAVTGAGQGVQLYDARTGMLWKTYPDNGQAASASTTGGYLSASVPLSGGSGAGATAWSPDGHLMATAFYGSYDQAVQVWNTSTGHLVQTYTGQADVGSLSWSADGTSIASSGGGGIQVWNALTGQRIYDFEPNTNC